MEDNSKILNVSKIQVGDYIIIQRQNYTKLHKFSNLESTAMLGKDQLLLGNINDNPYFSTFKMTTAGKKSKRAFSLELCSNVIDLKESLGEREYGVDNRNILDDGQSQQLTTEDISRLRESDLSSSDIVSRLVDNSKTFSSKTEYSQEKYLKKKEKKYFEYVVIKRPTLRLISEIYYRQEPAKILGLRIDSLAQLLCYANINSNSSCLLYESGTNGLLPAAILNAIGSNTSGTLVHMHPGNVPQKQGLLALNLPNEQLERCISVNLYSVLRVLYQGQTLTVDTKKRKHEESDKECESTAPKLIKCDSENISTDNSTSEIILPEALPMSVKKVALNTPTKQKWELDNARACSVLQKGMDSLVICAKEHPSNIVKALLPLVNNSAPVVIFSVIREPLCDLYGEFKQRGNVTGLRLTDNWLRNYQVLPNRTHPDVNMAASSGYLLTGWVIQ